ncbi:MAG: hypothetical protein ABJN42_24610 [Roseibium sp.]|uniref:hypothetical protein n=1 Tax=Roseibium sp. TaxID=1936156 RepID=UPI003299F1EA
MAYAATQTPMSGEPIVNAFPSDFTEDQTDVLDVLSSTAALLPPRGIAENVLDGEAPAPADVLRTRDDLEFLVEKGIVVSTRNERGMKVYGLKEFFPNV